MSDIDPQEFGRLQAEVEALRRDTDKQTETLAALVREVSEMRRQMDEAKGGWRMLMLMGGAAAAGGGTLMAVAQKLFKVIG